MARRTLAFFLVLIMAMCTMGFTKAAESLVRVGYTPGYGMLSLDQVEGHMGYGYDYLMEVSKYTGWKYEFVPCTWEEGIAMLERGELDIFGPVQRTKETEQTLDFTSVEFSYEYGILYARSESNYYYDDISALNGARVLARGDNNFVDEFNEFCRINGITCEIVKPTGTGTLEEEFKNSDCDMVFASSMEQMSDIKIISKVTAEKCYLTTTKGNSRILGGLNFAMKKIFMADAYFPASLYKKYYSNLPSIRSAFTKDEVEYIASTPKLRVVCDPDWAPIEYYDKKSKIYKGITIDILRSISASCGIEFEIIQTENFAQSVEMIKNGEADIITGHSELASSYDVAYTNEYLSVSVRLVGNDLVDIQDDLVVAVGQKGTQEVELFMRNFPHFTYLNCDTVESRIQAIKTGEADLALVNTYVLNEIAREESDFINIPTSLEYLMTIGVAKQHAPTLINILNKSIDKLTEESINSIVFSNTVNREYQIPLSKIIRDNAIVIIIVVAVLFAMVVTVIFINTRITSRKLKHLAYVDSTTNLSSLLKFRKDATDLLKNADDGEYMIFSVDVNDFKYINEVFGYEVGNKVLRGLSDHFVECVEPGSLVGRMSADNFIILTKAMKEDDIYAFFDKICKFSDHIEDVLPDHYWIIFSAGAYIIDDPYADIVVIIDHTNVARKSKKGSHEHTLVMYTKEMAVELEKQKEITMSMDRAIVNHEFVVYLQPKVCFEGEEVVGAEALVRWIHPKRGFISPGMFIPLFEKNGFIQKLDIYMFEQVCSLIADWKEKNLLSDKTNISVNLSKYSLKYPMLTEKLKGLVEEYGIESKWIEIELTESAVMENMDLLLSTMKEFKDFGFKVSIDDFGSGYSSLNLLKDISADALKIDKEFLSDSANTVKGKMIISSVIEMAQKLKLITVAEGVETLEQVVSLRTMGCDIAQGFYYATPMPAEEFEKKYL